MSVANFSQLLSHVGHEIECVTYGQPPANVAVECMTCSEVILDFDRPETRSPDMPDIQSLPADHVFTLRGSLIVTLYPGSLQTLLAESDHTYNLYGETAGVLYADLLNTFELDGRNALKVILQYTGGSDNKEAGSSWFIMEADEFHSAAENAVDTIIKRLLEIENGFAAGREFMP